MAEPPDYITNISLILSRVMNDVGVNEEGVMRRRRAIMVTENIPNLCHKLKKSKNTGYIFGSQTEGTTTEGLNSDIDILVANESINMVQDWKDWMPGKHNLLMIRDELRYPGYCKLKILRDDAPLSLSRIVSTEDSKFGIDGGGNMLFKDHNIPAKFPEGTVRHGPAAQRKQGEIEYEFITAYKCVTWPYHYKQWTPNDKSRDWPTQEMIRHMKTTGCFIVKVAHRLDEENETWRISTSLAERCLMFSLNITQTRCYILLKMIVKTFIEPYMPDTISSYICKTLLFHCIENTRKDMWKEHNLLKCVQNCLLYMIAAVLDEMCPNYFNESINLMLEKVDDTNKVILLKILRTLLKTRGRFLVDIKFDNINARLSKYIFDSNKVASQEELDSMKLKQFRPVLLRVFTEISASVRVIGINLASSLVAVNDMVQIIGEFAKQGEMQSEATRIFLPFLCSYKASVEASKSISNGTDPTPETLKLFDLSLHSDVTSLRLKFASYLYCTGQFERTLLVLEDVEKLMTDSVLMVCGCHYNNDFKYPPGFGQSEISLKYPSTKNLAMCVTFSKAEIRCCPRELRCELFRSTDEERRDRKFGDEWMELAVIDSLPYLYFLQYMTYRYFGQRDRQLVTLDKLLGCLLNNKYLTHRETGLNILGQCLEYEGVINGACKFYKLSLEVRPTNNAARWHIMRLMWFVRQAGF